MQHDHTHDAPEVEPISQEEFDGIIARALPVRALSTYAYGPASEGRAMVQLWVEIDEADPALASLWSAMRQAIVQDEAFDLDHSLTVDLRGPITPETFVRIWWDIAFKRHGQPVARFSFPLILPMQAMQIAAIAEEGALTICPLPSGSELAQQIRQKQTSATREARQKGIPLPDYLLPLHLNFPADSEKILMVEGFMVEVPEPDTLLDMVVLYYELAGSPVEQFGFRSATDGTGCAWDDILTNGDIHFSRAG
jgi:hypothetical protein